ncbi:MAG: glycosyltransferase [Sphingobacteriales bacterium]|nr:MAG: glycosyltransferase [Sphingobacteriales bacterium]
MHLSSYSCNTNLLIHKKRLCEGKIIVKQCTRCSYETLYHFPSVFAAMFSKLSNKVQQSNLTERIPPGKLRSLFSIPFHIERIKSELQDLVVLVDRIICISEWYKKVLLLNDVPEEKITVVQPALTHEISHLGFPQEKESRLPIRFVFIGRLLPIKGIHTLIEAFREFQQEQVVLDIYGEFDDENYRERCLSMVQSNTVVHFKGKLSRNEVIPILKNYDMFCLASASSEMSPLVIQEAFAAGIPVLASRVYGNMEQVRSEENGLLFEFDSVDSLRSKVKRLLSDPQILKNLKSNIVSPREFSLVVEDYLRIYESSSL